MVDFHGPWVNRRFMNTVDFLDVNCAETTNLLSRIVGGRGLG